MRSIFIFSFLLSGIFQHVYGQKYTLSGYIKDKATGESLPNAVLILKPTNKGTTTNAYGFYSITVEKGNYTINSQYIGYKTISEELELSSDKKLNIELELLSKQVKEVEITAQRKDKNVTSTDMGKLELTTKEARLIPALMGEVDVMRTLQLMPGVIAAGEGNSGFYVRGGGPDQNLVLLDNAVVYNPGHLFGFFSVFNSDAIKNTTLIKGGIPASYGGRLSSVVDISMKEGNMKRFQVEGGIGLISSRLTLQGPIKKDKASFIVSGRRTYIDVLAKPFVKSNNVNIPYFYDLNAKLNWKISEKDRIYASGYFGRDVFKFSGNNNGFKLNFPWGNTTATIRWNHLFHDKLFMNSTLIYNDYGYKFDATFQDVTFLLKSRVQDYSAKVDFDYYPSPIHKIKTGLDYTYHKFTPNITQGKSGDSVFTNQETYKYAHLLAWYAQDEIDINEHIKVNIGGRSTVFFNTGPYEKIEFNNLGQAIDTTSYGANKVIQNYIGFEPRINATFLLNKSSSIKAAYTYTNQYIHLVSSSTTTLPTDIWVPSSEKVKPQKATQYSIGYFKNFKNNMYETSVELYYKDMKNQIEFSESRDVNSFTDIEDQFTFGKGRSYGAELFLKKSRGKLNGWIGYTLSYTYKQFNDLNNGKWFPAKYDRRHDLNVVLIYEINKKLTLSSTFVYASGNTTTIAVGRYLLDGEFRNIYGDRNGYRLPAYHRLDLGLTWVLKDTERKHHDISFSIYNVYNRMNPYFIYNNVDGNLYDGSLNIQAKQVSLFPVLPSVTWNFKF